MTIEHLRAVGREAVAGRRVVLATGPLVPASALAGQLVELGAERCLVLAESRGSGDVCLHPSVESIVLEIRSPDLMGSFRRYARTLADPPPDVRARIDAFDPDGEAIVLVSPVVRTSTVAGRPAFGRHEEAWLSLENKVLVDPLWDEAGIERAPYEIVRARRDALVAASRRLDRGDGVVWTGDADDGPHGGATGVRWIRPGMLARNVDDVDEAVATIARLGARARVMPFLDGIPCSIHGIVLPDGIVVLRPVEVVVLRPPSGPRFLYAGVASYWDPAPADRDEMRSVARRVGTALRRTVGYRGGYTVDGIMTAEGFRPTELNARPGAGFWLLARSCPDIPLVLLDTLIRAGRPLDGRADRLERLVLAAADAERGGGGWTTLSRPFEPDMATVAIGPGGRLAHQRYDGDAPIVGTLYVGPSSLGGFVRFAPDPALTPIGPSIAPRVAEAFAVADAHFGTGLGALHPAPSRR